MGSAAVAFSATEPAPARARPAVPDWQAPVAGELLRSFDPGAHPFAGGAHRGIDLDARLGAPVAATCGGRVAFAGAVAGERVVTLACGGWRVTHLPMTHLAVAGGDRVRRGQRLGTVGAGDGHAGLHVGVRRAGRRFGYVDPWPLLQSAIGDSPGPVAAPLPRSPRGRRAPAPSPPTRTLRAPRTGVSSARGPAVVTVPGPHVPDAPPANAGHPARLAPPLAWAGLALLLLGAARARPRSKATGIRLRAKEPATRAR